MSYKDFSDEEIVEMILEAFDEDGRVRTDFVDIDCSHGKVSLAGRVYSEEELQVVDEILTDVLEIENYDNQIWVDDSLVFENTNEDSEEETLEIEEEVESETFSEEDEEEEEA